jgi:hypothetical protein
MLNILSKFLIKRKGSQEEKWLKFMKSNGIITPKMLATWEIESYLNQNFHDFLNPPKGARTFHTRILIQISGRDSF